MTRHDIYAGVQQRKRHGDAPGVRSPRKRRAGARRGSAPLAVLLALVMALAFPARARADGVLPSTGWDPFTWYSNSYGVEGTLYCVTNSASDFNSALYLIGRMSDYLQLSYDQLAKLSNEGSGGRFYELANKFVNGGEVDLVSGYPGIGAVDASAISVACGLYGAGNTWFAKVTQDELEGAYTDYMVIYNGGSLGGGASDIPGYVAIGGVQVPCAYPNASILAYDDNGANSKSIAFDKFSQNFNNTLYIKSESQAYIDSIKQGTPVYLITNTNYSSGLVRNFELQVFTPRTSETRFTFTIADSNTNSRCSYSGSVTKFSYLQTAQIRYTGTGDNEHYYLICTSTFSSSNYYSTGSNSSDTFQWWYSDGSSVGGSGGGGGDNNWPGPSDEDEPGPPEPVPQPEPDPGPGPIDWPDPYNPTVPSPDPEPTPTTPVTNPTNTSPADYTPWLMAILSELRGIHTDMNAWLDAIFEGIVDYGAAVCSHIDTASENVRSTLRFMTQWMDEQLDSSFYALRHLLWECANYIADSLDYTFVGPDVNVPGYDDSSVLYWLKRIYYKLGSGNVNTRPVDPVADHDNWWDWIVQLIKNLILDLGMMGSDFLSDMGDVLSEVVQKFPFSIPWDIAAYLTAFSTQPVTPVIVITMPAISGFLPQTQFTIDLHPYDDAMATVRAVEVIVFTFWLMWKCPILLDMMDTAKWGI